MNPLVLDEALKGDEINPPVLGPTEQADIEYLIQKVPHVPAWCYRADGLLLPDGLPAQDCSPSCSDYRVLTATKLYDAGVRPPLQKPTFLKVGQEKPVPVGSKHPAGTKLRVPTPAKKIDKQPGSGVQEEKTS